MPEIVDAEIIESADDQKESPMQKFSISRSAIKFVATSSVRFVVSSAITTLVPVESKKEKRKVFVASMVLSGMINEHVKPYVDTEIDDALDFYREVVKYAKTLQAKQDKETDDFLDTVRNAPDL